MTGPVPTTTVSDDTSRGPGVYEVKFTLPPHQARLVERWARQRLLPDPHGIDGRYRTTTLYVDTPGLDIFNRSPGHRRSKYRLRWYGAETVFVEKKSKKSGLVRKKRTLMDLRHLDHLPHAAPEPAAWFQNLAQQHQFQPVCRVAYERTAFVGDTPEGRVRLTLDRNLIGEPEPSWTLKPVSAGRALLPEVVILELKFAALPRMFRELLGELPAPATGVSKYRRCVQVWKPVGESL